MGVYFCIFYFIFCAFLYFEHTEDEVGAVKRFHGAQRHSRSGAAGQMAARIEKRKQIILRFFSLLKSE